METLCTRQYRQKSTLKHVFAMNNISFIQGRIFKRTSWMEKPLTGLWLQSSDQVNDLKTFWYCSFNLLALDGEQTFTWRTCSDLTICTSLQIRSRLVNNRCQSLHEIALESKEIKKNVKSLFVNTIVQSGTTFYLSCFPLGVQRHQLQIVRFHVVFPAGLILLSNHKIALALDFIHNINRSTAVLKLTINMSSERLLGKLNIE